MADTDTTWEERIMKLEGQDDEKQALLLAVRDELGKGTDKITALEATVAALTKADLDRKTVAAEAYLAGIKAEACNAGSPISVENLATVQKHLEKGDHETARELGDTYLQLSKATGGGNVGPRDPAKVTLLATTPDDEFLDKSAESVESFKKRWASRLPSLQGQAS